MKRILVLFLLITASCCYAQNEFAATAFYNEFKKIYADGQEGFSNCRGIQYKTVFDAIQTEYRVKCILPLADSGKLVIPQKTKPYAIYYFEPDKVRLKIDQLGVNLRDAVMTAFGQPLYSRSETYMVENNPFNNTLFFAQSNEERFSDALFRQCIYYSNGKYFLSFEIFGKRIN